MRGQLELGRRGRNWSQRLRGDPLCCGRAGRYGVVSVEPPVLVIKYWYGAWAMMQSMRPLYDALADEPLLLLVWTSWWMGSPEAAADVAAYDRLHRRRYPRHTLVHMANTPEERDAFAAARLQTQHVSQYALIDEHVFRPLGADAPAKPRLDAVYDARFKRFKRHELTRDTGTLGLIYARDDVTAQRGYGRQTRDRLAHRYLFNERDGQHYRALSPVEVNAALNCCGVGLALSQEEGAMWACGQYLLAGLPVVSTPSRGGRDLFFDVDVACIVEPDPRAVAEGVREMLERNVDPMMVRERTLARIAEHRGRFLAIVRTLTPVPGSPERRAKTGGTFSSTACSPIARRTNR